MTANLNNPKWQNRLPKLQGNILKHHGRKHALHLFINFAKADTKAVKTFLQSLQITSAEAQHKASLEYKLIKAIPNRTNEVEERLEVLNKKVVTFLLLSKTGVKHLGLKDTALTDDGFQKGMKARTNLADPAPKTWEINNDKQQVDALIIIASNSNRGLQQAKETINRSLPAKAIILHTQAGTILRNEAGLGIEHFGYVDGISQPLMIAGEAEDEGLQWNDETNPESVVLFNDPLVRDKDAFASYFVFRKLDQNVKGFKDAEKGLGLGEIGGAYIVGRFEDGTPVAVYGEEKKITDEKQLENDFNYKNDPEGNKCPFHSHIRITNPRDLQPTKPIRVVRRGIPYDEAGRNNNLAWHPEGGVGLLFMCYAKSITNQFEILQANWANDGNVFRKQFAIDAVIGQGNNNRLQEYPQQWGEAPRISKCNMSGFVTMKGGEYFYAPSISTINNL